MKRLPQERKRERKNHEARQRANVLGRQTARLDVWGICPHGRREDATEGSLVRSSGVAPRLQFALPSYSAAQQCSQDECVHDCSWHFAMLRTLARTYTQHRAWPGLCKMSAVNGDVVQEDSVHMFVDQTAHPLLLLGGQCLPLQKSSSPLRLYPAPGPRGCRCSAAMPPGSDKFARMPLDLLSRCSHVR